MAAALPKINLLPKEGFEYTTGGRVLTWALSAGRIIVILTELIVILAFLSRFWFDRQLTNLNEKIKQQAAFIRASQDFEQKFKVTQQKLSDFTLISQNSNDAELMRKILDLVPQEVVISQVTIDQQQTEVMGVALSENSIETFIANLKNQNLGDVAINQASFGTAGDLSGIQFTLEIIRTKQAAKSQQQGGQE